MRCHFSYAKIQLHKLVRYQYVDLIIESVTENKSFHWPQDHASKDAMVPGSVQRPVIT